MSTDTDEMLDEELTDSAELAEPQIDVRQQIDSDVLRISIPSHPEWVGKTVQFLEERALAIGLCDDSRLFKIATALHEAITNSVVHGNLEVPSALKENGDEAFVRRLAERANDPRYVNRLVQIDVTYDGQTCEWTLTDEGPGFDLNLVKQPANHVVPDDSADDELLCSGRGIIMMRSMMDSVDYDLGGRRVRMKMEKGYRHEKRKHERHAFQEPVEVVPVRSDGTIDWEAAYRALARDVSEGGIALLQHSLHRASRVMVEVKQGDRAIYLPAEVCHAQTLAGDIVQLGCRLSPIENAQLDENESDRIVRDRDEIHRIIGEIIDNLHRPVSNVRRRQFQRIVYTETVQVAERDSSEAVTAYARNLSKGGLAFIAGFPLSFEEIQILLPGMPRWLLAQVVRSTEVSTGFYDIGARFVGWGDRPLESP